MSPEPALQIVSAASQASSKPAARRNALKSLRPAEQPRERIARGGLRALKDEELLAVLLRTGYRNKDVLTLSRELLKLHPGGTLFQLSFKDLSRIKGVGAAKSAALLAAWELARRHFESPDRLPVLRDAKDVCAQVADIRGRNKEHFVALYLNTRNQLLHREVVSVGTLNASLVHPREVFEPALRLSAAALVLVHNHPSGDPTPSAEDRRVTRQLAEAGKLLGLDVLDHVVVTAASHHSFQENGGL